MRIYLGQTRDAKLVRRLWKLGIGECTTRGRLPPRRHPWFYDNGAYEDWKAGAPFDEAAFLEDLDAIYRSIDRPEFIVLPDIVAGGRTSLKESRRWIHRCRGLAPLYLAVQDGMDPTDIDARLAGAISGLFIGGTLDWKIREGATWRELASALRLRCHIGRVGGPNRVRWAMRIGADSIDSSLPLFSEDNLQRFLRALEPSPQSQLDFEADEDERGVA